jgi:RNA-directed DNA polymerase
VEIKTTSPSKVDAQKAWKGIKWKRCAQKVNKLQRRIFKAARKGDTQTVEFLQNKLLRSKEARLLAVKKVTMLNKGKKTPGVDGKASLNHNQRLALVQKLNKATKWKHSDLKDVIIPKKDGSIRTLKIPTIEDRAWQCLIKFVIEPAHEATFHARSYGFRPGRGAWDVQKICFLNLSSNKNGKDKRVLEIDIKKCFDRISHESILSRVIAPILIKIALGQCLKKGTDVRFPDQGTPQGGIISPLLANIALNGIEEIHSGARYADDMVFFLKEKDDSDGILIKVKTFLAERGLEVSEAKTKTVAALNGFDFLGWRLRVRNNGKFRSQPSEANFTAFQNKVRAIVKNSCIGAKAKAKLIAPIVRGWKKYHQNCCIKGKFSLWYLSLSAYRRFLKEKKIDRYEAERLVKNAFPIVPYSENRHVNVAGNRSVFDGDTVYWSQRESKHYDGSTAKALKRQNYVCAECGLGFDGEERIQLHHVDLNHGNWQPANLQALHNSCHMEIHYAH